jgi:hypothetical protein
MIADRCSRPPLAGTRLGSLLRSLACGAYGATPGDLLFAQALIAGWFGLTWSPATTRRSLQLGRIPWGHRWVVCGFLWQVGQA